MWTQESRIKQSKARKAFQERVGHIHRGPKYHGKWYKVRWIPEHPNSDKAGKIDEHRLIASKAIGKPLKTGVVVHHHNGGFRGGELVICENNAYHKLLHVRQRAYEATGDSHKRKCSFCKEWDDIKNMRPINRPSRETIYEHRKCRRSYSRERLLRF